MHTHPFVKITSKFGRFWFLSSSLVEYIRLSKGSIFPFSLFRSLLFLTSVIPQTMQSIMVQGSYKKRNKKSRNGNEETGNEEI